jgi:hypothetical protein
VARAGRACLRGARRTEAVPSERPVAPSLINTATSSTPSTPEIPEDAEEFTEVLDGPEGGTAFQVRVEYRWGLAA